MERCDQNRPVYRASWVPECPPVPARLHKLGNLLHLSQWRQTGFVTALSTEGAVTRPVARSFNPARLSKFLRR
jgi:hypothetical protein